MRLEASLSDFISLNLSLGPPRLHGAQVAGELDAERRAVRAAERDECFLNAFSMLLECIWKVSTVALLFVFSSQDIDVCEGARAVDVKRSFMARHHAHVDARLQ